jgi:uncharacterized surface protein with fasciclin (FAS1) repeats
MKLYKSVLVALIVALLASAFAVFSPAPVQAKSSAPTIVGVALSVNATTGEFSTLIAALKAAGLVDALNGRGQYTVFAPTDAAFAKLGLNASNIGSLPKGTLTNILLYHVAHGRRPSTDLLYASQIRMLNGQFASLKVMSSTLYVNSSAVISADVFASNGVIHVIDTVLMPR